MTGFARSVRSVRRGATLRLGSLAIVSALLVGGCSSATTPPADRAVSIATTACGHTSKTIGSGVLVDSTHVLTAAHVVVGATDVTIDGEPATIVRLDATTDLALLALGKPTADTVTMITTADAKPGDPVTLVGGVTSGSVETSIGRKLDLRVDDVRASSRSVRHGYEIDTQLAPGDSGAGVFNANSELVAVIFSGPVDRDGRSFAVDHREIDKLLTADNTLWTCAPDANRVEQDL